MTGSRKGRAPVVPLEASLVAGMGWWISKQADCWAGISLPHLSLHSLKVWSPHKVDMAYASWSKEKKGPGSSGGAVTHETRGSEPAKTTPTLDASHRYIQGGQGGIGVAQDTLADPTRLV